MKAFFIITFVVAACLSGWYFWNRQAEAESSKSKFAPAIAMGIPTPLPSFTPSPSPSPTPSPTPKPLTLAEMNKLYGPCVSLPILMYHHVQTEEQASLKKQNSLSVYTPIFKEQMQYLKDKGYTTILPQDLINFFADGKALPTKPVLITVDDGYADNYTDLFPILKENNQKSTIFLATGLMENPDYLTWNQVKEMADYGIYFGNHTWSHQNMMARLDKIEYELSTAQTQLSERGLNQNKIFSFPYGLQSGQADKYLTENGYALAFDTQPGRIQCAQKKYALTRIRIGNASLKQYGL